MSAVIETRDLSKHYRLGRDNLVKALDDVDLAVEGGEILAITGPSGSGKSTLLNMLGLLDTPTSGKVFLNGADVTGLSGGKKTDLRARHIGFIFQEFDLIPTLTAKENVMLPLRYQGIGRRQRREAAFRMLEHVGLDHRLDHRPSELSGGEQQRVAIARALVGSPSLVLADEPTGELDSKTGAELLGLLQRINDEEGTTFIIVTHDQAVAASADRVVRVKDGRIYTD